MLLLILFANFMIVFLPRQDSIEYETHVSNIIYLKIHEMNKKTKKKDIHIQVYKF